MVRACLTLGAAWLAITLSSAAFALSVETETVNYSSGNETVSGFLALPDSPPPHSALVVVHEWWGLTDWVREQTRKFAAAGYVALAVDLYRGRVAYDPDLAHELSRDLPQDQALRDLKATFDYLASRPEVRKEGIGAVGWCMGGGYAVRLAVNEPKLAACVVNYGPLPTDKDDIQKIQAPLLGNFGAEDRDIPRAAVKAFESTMKAAHKSIDVKIYDRAGHAFENRNNHLGYREEAAEDAWIRTLAFLDRTLNRR